MTSFALAAWTLQSLPAALDLLSSGSQRVAEVGLRAGVAGELAIGVATVAAMFRPATADRAIRVGAKLLRRIRTGRAGQRRRRGAATHASSVLGSTTLVHAHLQSPSRCELRVLRDAPDG